MSNTTEATTAEQRAAAKRAADDAARCSGCGKSFNGLRGLRAHQSQRWIAGACKAQK